VHALGQVASVTLKRPVDARTVFRAVNARLPESVRVLRVEDAPPAFHARFDARAKVYRYRLWNGWALNPFERLYAWHIPAPALDVDAMSAAARLLEGTHDFQAFQGTGAQTHTTVRRLFSSRIAAAGTADLQAVTVAGVLGRSTFGSDREPPADGRLIVYDVCGEGFLRHMVRAIVGTLVEVGHGRLAVAQVSEVVASRSRAMAGPTAPAQGLFLARVVYETPDL
jgi:tRNA pseudouridine38-40 synthase